MLYTAHQEVVEERCELEEAENDSRLRAQKSVSISMIYFASSANIQIAGSQNCCQFSPVMDTLTQVGVIFRRVQDVAGPWKEMEIIYRKSRTAENNNMHHPV